MSQFISMAILASLWSELPVESAVQSAPASTLGQAEPATEREEPASSSRIRVRQAHES